MDYSEYDKLVAESKTEHYNKVREVVDKVEAGMRGNIAERKEEIVLILSKKTFDLDASEEKAEKTKEYYDSLFREKKTTTGRGLQTHQHKKDKKLEKKSTGSVTPSAKTKQKQAEKGMAKLDKTIVGTNSRDHEEQVARQKTKPPPHPDTHVKNKDEDGGNSEEKGEEGDPPPSTKKSRRTAEDLSKSTPVKSPFAVAHLQEPQVMSPRSRQARAREEDGARPTPNDGEEQEVRAKEAAAETNSGKVAEVNKFNNKNFHLGMVPFLGIMQKEESDKGNRAPRRTLAPEMPPPAASGATVGQVAKEGTLPPGVTSPEMLELLERASRYFQCRFFEGQKMPSLPWASDAIKVLMPIARNNYRNIGLTKICLAAKFESYTPYDDQIQEFSTLRTNIFSKLEQLDQQMSQSMNSWREYFLNRPTLIYQTMAFSQIPNYRRALRLVDGNMTLNMTTFLYETIKGYSAMSEALDEVDEFIAKRTLLTRKNFYM